MNMTVLSKCPIFKGLAAVTLEHLSAGAVEAEYKRGSVVFGRGTPATGIHVVADGQIKLSLENQHGDEHVIEIMASGDSFGEATLLADRPHQMTAAAVSDSHLLHVTRQALLAEIERDPELSRRLIRTLSERLCRRTVDMENCLLRKASWRVARFLLEQESGPTSNGVRRITLPAKKGIIASQLNMTQEHFSRTLHDMSAKGLIAVKGAVVSILDEAGLRQYSR
jgi:CRP-like cAMP-binding protein